MRRGIILVSFLFVYLFLLALPAQADICYPARNIAQFACVVGPDFCPAANKYNACAANPSRGCSSDHPGCDAGSSYATYEGPCKQFCSGWVSSSECKSTGSYLIACTAAPDCEAHPNIETCNDGLGPDGSTICLQDSETLTYGCWGPGANTPTPTPNPGNCGNGICDGSENCNNCPADCGTCSVIDTPTPTPTPGPGMIRVRAMTVVLPNTSCSDIQNSSTAPVGTVTHQFTPSSASQPAPQTQSGTSYTVFSDVIPGSYTISTQVPAGYVLSRACWTNELNGTSGEGVSQTLVSGGFLTWNLGYTQGTAWSQAAGGEVYASANLTSFVPVGASPRAFILNGTTGGYPGVATYGTDTAYNFDSSGATKGEAWVSSKNWLAYDPSPAPDFYQLMYSQFGGAPASVDYVNPASPITMPASRATPYYVTGNMTTSGNWNVAAGQTIVFLVNGNLAIAGNITVAPGGFAAFIVNGTIAVDPAVAGVAGIYLTSSAGTFNTGTGAVRFTGTGTFVAGNFILGRNLGDAGNPTTSSELFVYNPQLLMTMPEQMKKLSVSWQEVAP